MQNNFSLGDGAIAKVAQAAVMVALPKSLKGWFTNLERHVKGEEVITTPVGSPNKK